MDIDSFQKYSFGAMSQTWKKLTQIETDLKNHITSFEKTENKEFILKQKIKFFIFGSIIGSIIVVVGLIL